MKRKLKQNMSLALTVMMLMTNSGLVNAQDISNHWANKTLSKWKNSRFLKGDEKGNLNPNNQITRAEFITMINNALLYKGQSDKIKNYTDVSKNDWYYNQISIALAKGYIAGTNENKISPNKNITRQEVMHIINSIAKLKDIQIDLSVVKDSNSISSWAKQSVQNMIANGYISGYEGNIRPNSPMTRAEAVVLIDSYKENNRVLSFKGSYELGHVNTLKINTGDIIIKNTQIKNLVINENASGKIQLEDVKILENITNNSKNVEIFDGKNKLQVTNKKLEVAQEENNLKYKDGVYTGKATGYKSDIEVEVTIKDGKISKIDVIKQQEDKIYWSVAQKVVDKIIEKQQSQVDSSAGATISSKGIMFAVQDALKKAEIKKEQVKPNDELKDGEYIGEANGFSGIVKVKVVVKDGKIDDVKVLSHSDDDPYMQSAKNIISNIKDKQNADVDVIGGATYSSNGIINAVKDALEQAKGKTNKTGQSKYAIENMGGGGSGGGGVSSEEKIEQDFTNLKNGVYESVATGHYKDSIKVRVTVENNKISKIELLQNNDDKSYFDDDKAQKIAKSIIEKQSTKVDTISGATNSSKGFINAVAGALSFAGSEKEISVDTDAKNTTIQIAKVVAQNLKVQNLNVNEDLIITEKVAEGNLTLKNLHVKGNVIVQGGGKNSIYFINCKIDGDIKVEKTFGENVRLEFSSDTKLQGKVEVNTPAIVETKDDIKIPKVELTSKLKSEQLTQIKANVNFLDVKNDDTKILVKKGSNINHISLPSNIENYQEGKTVYKNPKKQNFELKIETDVKIDNGTNRKVDEQILAKNNILLIEQVKDLDKNVVYTDGVYYGDSTGFVSQKPLPVKVTVSGGKVTEIEKVGDEIKILHGNTNIDDGGKFEEKFHVVKNMVINGKNPQEILYTLSKISEISDKVMQALENQDFKMTHISENPELVLNKINKAFDEVLGKHNFGENSIGITQEEIKDANQLSKKSDLKSVIRKKVTLYFVEELGYSKEPIDAISNATYTGMGSAKSIKNALSKMDKDIVDMRIVHNYKTEYSLGDTLDLSNFAVKLYDRNYKETLIPYSKFEENGIKMYNFENKKEVTQGTILNEETLDTLSTISPFVIGVEHVPSGSSKIAQTMVVKSFLSIPLEDVKLQVAVDGTDIWYDTIGLKAKEDEFVKNIYVEKTVFDKIQNKKLKFKRITKTKDSDEKIFEMVREESWQNNKKNYLISIPFQELKISDTKNYQLRPQNLRITLLPYNSAIDSEKTFAENYNKEISELTLLKNATVDKKYVSDLFSDAFLNTKINIVKEPDTSTNGKTTMEVQLTFEDNSTKNIVIDVNVVGSNKAKEYKYFFDSKKLKLYAVVSPENFKNNAAVQKAVKADELTKEKIVKQLQIKQETFGDVQIEVVQEPNRSSVDNNTYTVLKITFEDGSLLERLEVPTKIEKLKIVIPTTGDEDEWADNNTKQAFPKVVTDEMSKNYRLNAKITDIDKLQLTNVTISTGRIAKSTFYLWDDKTTDKLEQNIYFDDFKNFEIVVINYNNDFANPITKDTTITKKIVDTDTNTLKIKVFMQSTGDDIEIEGLKVSQDKSQADAFKEAYANLDSTIYTIVAPETENLKENDKIKLIVSASEITADSIARDIDLKTKASNLSIENVKVSLVEDVNRNTIGSSTAKIKLTFEDTSELEYEVPLMVRPIPVYQFLISNIVKGIDKEYSSSQSIDLKNLNIYIKPYGVRDGVQMTMGGANHLELKYDDFKYFGLKVVKENGEEVQNIVPVNEVTNNGQIELYVYYGVQKGDIEDNLTAPTDYFPNMDPDLSDSQNEKVRLPFTLK